MKRAGVIGIGSALLAGVMAPCALAATGTAVSGTVRDANGAPQMGALIELLTPSASLIAQAITDEQGHYLLRIAQAGIYQLRATSSLLPPALQPRLVLRSGANTVADLTLPADGLPRSVKVADAHPARKQSDDWRWVLRSPANRPLLRWVDDDGNDSIPAQPGSENGNSRQTRLTGELRWTGGSGAFGQGSYGQSVALERAQPAGDSTRLTATWSDDPSFAPEVALQMHRVHSAGAKSSLAVLVSAHPEFVSNGRSGYRVLQSAATESFALGDMVQIDVGTLLTAEQLVGSRVASSPYLRVGIAPSPALSVEYRYAADRALQRTADLETTPRRPEVLADTAGRPLPHAGSHHELAITRTTPSAAISLAAFHDDLSVQAIDGVGALSVQGAALDPLILDTATSTFRLAAAGLHTAGLRASLVATSHAGASARLEAAYGRVVGAPSDPGVTLSTFSDQTSPRPAAMIRASAHLRSARFGTGLETSYRWQPHWTLTQVDAYDAEANDAYLGLALVQHLWSGARTGSLEAVLQASNLLAEGYIPVVSADGRRVYLAQVPRTVQATLAFRF